MMMMMMMIGIEKRYSQLHYAKAWESGELGEKWCFAFELYVGILVSLGSREDSSL